MQTRSLDAELTARCAVDLRKAACLLLTPLQLRVVIQWIHCAFMVPCSIRHHNGNVSTC
jgi:hypothetical protein